MGTGVDRVLYVHRVINTHRSPIPITNDWDSVIQISCWIGRCGRVMTNLMCAAYLNEMGVQEMVIGKMMKNMTVIITW